MALPAGLTWEVRTTGNANNGGAFIDLIPGTSVDYSQQNGAQLSKADLASAAASVTITSVTGGFTASMVGNVIQIRAGGVNFVAGFYQIVLFNSVNSVNLDRTPNSGNATGGLGEVGGALISPETFILNGVAGNLCYVKSGTYNFAASRTFVATNTTIFGYDTARNIVPTGNNRPLFALGAFFITQVIGTKSTLRNIRLTGSGTQLISIPAGAGVHNFFNCYFQNTNNAGNRYCINSAGPNDGLNVIDCEFVGTVGATSYGVFRSGATSDMHAFLFNFFHDLTYGVELGTDAVRATFFKNIFARIGITSVTLTIGVFRQMNSSFLFNSFYGAGSSHIRVSYHSPLVYGNTFDGAAVCSLVDAISVNTQWHIENNDFWNNGAIVSGCVLDYDNIGLNPLWVNPGGNDFNFGPGSPNIDQALGIRLGV